MTNVVRLAPPPRESNPLAKLNQELEQLRRQVDALTMLLESNGRIMRSAKPAIPPEYLEVWNANLAAIKVMVDAVKKSRSKS